MYSDDFTDESRHMQALELGYQMDQQDDARYNSKDSGRSPDLDLPTKTTNSSDVSLCLNSDQDPEENLVTAPCYQHCQHS